MPSIRTCLNHLISVSVTLPNRGVRCTLFEEADNGFERMAAFYTERARGGVALIVTGGIAPNDEARPYPGGVSTSRKRPRTGSSQMQFTQRRSDCHADPALWPLRLPPELVAPSPLIAPISPNPPHELTGGGIERTIEDFANWPHLRVRPVTTVSRHGIRGLP